MRHRPPTSSTRAPERAYAFDPSLKLVALVRDPVERAYSQYHMHVRFGYETDTFEEALLREDVELGPALAALDADPDDYSVLINRVSYVARSRYAEQLERWLKLFPREQLLVLVTEELAADPAGAMKQVTTFLGVPEHRAHSYPRLHVGEYEPLSAATRDSLAGVFADDNRRLEELLGRSLPWTTPETAGVTVTSER